MQFEHLFLKKKKKKVFASDLFHYIPNICHSNSYASIDGKGYFYFYINKGSVPLDIANKKIKINESGLQKICSIILE